METKAVYAGSFDPVTYGHLDIIERGSKLFSEVIVGVGKNIKKDFAFSLEERISLISESTKKFSNVKVTSFDNLLVNFAKENNIKVDVDEYKQNKRKNYYRMLDEIGESILIKGVSEKLGEFPSYYSLGLVSSSEGEYVNKIMGITGMKKYFPVLISADDVENEKPAPDGFLLAAQRLGLKPSDCIVIEDAEKGIISAKRARMKVIAIPTKYTVDNDFSKADYIASKISEITKDLIDSL